MRDLINLAHLNEQTFGDKVLRREVLEMFQVQTPLIIDALYAVEGNARGDIAHRLKGSCLSIGATRLADAATVLEETPHATIDVRRLADATLQEIAELLRG